MKRSRYRARERDWAFMLFVKGLPCWWRALSPCDGAIEADHAGSRGLGRKADDRTVIPGCSLHHRQRTDFSGPFRSWTQEQMRTALSDAIEWTQAQFAVGYPLR